MKSLKIVINRIVLVLCIPVIGWFLYGVVRTFQESNIYEIEYYGNNPTEYVFPFAIDSVKMVVENMEWSDFKGFMEMESKSVRNSNYYCYRPITVSPGSYVFRYKGVVAMHDPIVYQYYSQSVELCSMSGDSTKVIVKNLDHSRMNGVKMWRSLRFERDYYYPKEVPAESTTIEEYELLRYIGKSLGYIEHMPYVQYPSELSKEDILYAFGGENPFSLKEMFEDESDTTKIGCKYWTY